MKGVIEWGVNQGVMLHTYIVGRRHQARVLLCLAGPVQIAQLCHLYSMENLLEHNT